MCLAPPGMGQDAVALVAPPRPTASQARGTKWDGPESHEAKKGVGPGRRCLRAALSHQGGPGNRPAPALPQLP